MLSKVFKRYSKSFGVPKTVRMLYWPDGVHGVLRVAKRRVPTVVRVVLCQLRFKPTTMYYLPTRRDTPITDHSK
jgi:hypothetical protein